MSKKDYYKMIFTSDGDCNKPSIECSLEESNADG